MSDIIIRQITADDDAAIAAIIRANLEAYRLNIPGTAYFDPELDHLSTYYDAAPDRRAYFILTDAAGTVLTDAAGTVLGGAGLAEFSGLDACAELQKIYLTDSAKGKGLGYALARAVETRARELGYRRLYLETHTALDAAIHLYERLGYQRIEQPVATVHTTMDRFYLKEL